MYLANGFLVVFIPLKGGGGSQVKKSYLLIYILCGLFFLLAIYALPICTIQCCDTRMPHLNCRQTWI